MYKLIPTIILGLSMALSAGVSVAEEDTHPAIKARKAVMQLYANNLGQLGAMARGNADYNADAASAAANNLALIVQLDQATFWPPETDSETLSGTRALPALWQNFPDVMAKGGALGEAIFAMQGAAGTDLAALQAAMRPLGAACGACHKAYRVPDE